MTSYFSSMVFHGKELCCSFFLLLLVVVFSWMLKKFFQYVFCDNHCLLSSFNKQKTQKNKHGEKNMNIWLLALLVYVLLFIISLSVAFMIDTLRVVIKRIVTKK